MVLILNLNKSESPFPTDASYQIWLKSIYWFWSCFKKKLTDGHATNGVPSHQLIGPFPIW